jgi:DNA-binding XRE family transcriptional regulator
MTKKQLAERINVDPKTLTNWETTKPELIKLLNLGLATEAHVEDVDKYRKQLEKLAGKNS